MKKTRKDKREIEQRINFFAEFLRLKEHFFKDLNKKLAIVKDSRNKSYVTYPPEILLLTVIMKNITGIVSMNKMTRDFNNDEAIANIGKALGFDELEEISHYDTINNFLKRLEVTELDKIRDYMIRELFKKRSLEKYRLMDKYWTIAIDGSQLYSFTKRHCEHCLKKEYNWKYIFRFKEGRASTIWAEVVEIKEINKSNNEVEDFVNDISYRGQLINITEFKEVKIKVVRILSKRPTNN
ncbi:MAG: transposase family protein [Clostridium sp.]